MPQDRAMKPGNPSPLAKYIIGVLAGVAYSATLYRLGVAGAIPLEFVLTLVGVKLIWGLVMCFNQEWRAIGAGLITSVPLTVMLFVAVCFAIW